MCENQYININQYIKSITAWVSEIPVQLLGSMEFTYKKHILLVANVL